MTDSIRRDWPPSRRQPIFNLPTVVIALAGVLTAMHLVQAVVSSDGQIWLINLLAFIPLRETHPEAYGGLLPGGEAARVWTFFTYGLLHADWGHLIINGVWLAAFGSPLAWRFGASRFVAFTVVGAVAGAALHLVFDPNTYIPMVGASAAISAHMAAVSRFAFAPGGPLWRTGVESYRRPAAPLVEVMRDGRVLAFLGIWFAINLLFGLSGAGTAIASGAIAWDAHIGGFLAGLLLFPLFDPVPGRR